MNMQGTQKVVKTRKEHWCAGCYRKFPKGTMLLKIDCLNVNGGGYFTWYVCPVCEAVSEEINCCDCDGTWDGGFAIEADEDYWEKRRSEIERKEKDEPNA